MLPLSIEVDGLKLAPSFFCHPSSSNAIINDDKVESDMQEVVGDLLGLLFTCLREDPFRPVRESAAVGLVDICLNESVGMLHYRSSRIDCCIIFVVIYRFFRSGL